MWFDHPRPLVIAHRGASIHAPENTLTAFRLAAQHGADAIELDVKLSADGQVVVIHDQYVDRTTNGHGRVCSLSIADLRELDAGSFFADKYRGESIPTLDEVFESIEERLLVNVELTNYFNLGDRLVEKVIELVTRYEMQSRVLFSSFVPLNLIKAARLLPQVPCGLLAWRGWKGAWARNFGWRGKYHALNPYVTDVTIDLVQRVHAKRKNLYVWTVNSEDNLKNMIELNVDGIITDDPALLCSLLGRKR